MITLPISFPWYVCTPVVYRFLEGQFVEQFFETGILRLSSFKQFKRHEDEQRLDAEEGETSFVHRTQEGGGQTFFANAYHGHNAYILSASLRYDEELRDLFGYDSYFRINDTTKFGMAVAKQIPGLMAGAEGPCLYQNLKIIERDLGYLDVRRFSDLDDPSKLNRQALERFINDQLGHYPYFLKHKKYQHQAEYRLVWLTPNDVEEFIDIQVPEALRFCSKPNELME